MTDPREALVALLDARGMGYGLHPEVKAMVLADWADAILAEFDVTPRENEMEWEYGVKWGDVKWGDESDDSRPTLCDSREHAERRAAESHGDKIVRRTPARAIPAGPWEEVPDE